MSATRASSPTPRSNGCRAASPKPAWAISTARSRRGLRVCAYEFTYLPVLKALKRAHDRGVDVQIVYHDTKKRR